MKKKASPIFIGTLTLTITGLIARFLGFGYRIYLSRAIGAEAMGIYQMITPVSSISFALCCGPIQTAISRFIAQTSYHDDDSQAHSMFLSGLILSQSISFLFGIILYTNAEFCASILLGEQRTTLLLKILALTFPFSSAHACIQGYYYGKQQTVLPAISQLAEQIIRIGSVVLILSQYQKNGIHADAAVAVMGLALGEFSAFILLFLSIRIQRFRLLNAMPDRENNRNLPFRFSNHRLFKALSSRFFQIHQIMILAFPLIANRFVLGLLQSIEAACIPGRLQAYGMETSQSLSVYGTLTGMALPFVLFPSTLVNSASVMLLPSVAEAQSLGDDEKIQRTATLSLQLCLILGILCTSVFVTIGNDFGIIFFDSKDAGRFITILGWLCPFLYLSTSMSSILHGMGKTGTTFLVRLTGMCLRLFFVIEMIPRWGINGCLIGMLFGELVDSCLLFLICSRHISLSLSAIHDIIRPMICAFLSSRFFHVLVRTQKKSSLMQIVEICFSCFLFVLFYFLLVRLTDRRKMRFSNSK
ncbi:MAG: polysaccharide biosynthesis protein [Clostridiales bacterium]|nr:polysaccharide biosynthesis protein [Clostridiales bacterium]